MPLIDIIRERYAVFIDTILRRVELGVTYEDDGGNSCKVPQVMWWF